MTRDVVRYALDAAVEMLSADLEEALRPSVTSDTQGVPGSPDIVATIYRKIEEAAVFVGDVTPIAVSDRGKACANPNVLLETGYANRAVGEHRVIQVWNTAFEAATLDKLPFDMRGRRAPMAFHLPSGANTAELRRVRSDLARRLALALKLALDHGTAAAAEPLAWQPHHEGDSDLWFDRSEDQIVTNPQHGTSVLRWRDHHPGYARILPSRWKPKPGARNSLASATGHPALLADARALSFGVSRGGALAYWPGEKVGGAHPTMAITQWFEATGEFWGVAGGFLFERDGRRTLSTGYFFKQWRAFLRRNAALALEHGGSLPLHVRLGVNGLSGSRWPAGPFDFADEGRIAVEPAFEHLAVLVSADGAAIDAVAVDAFNGLAGVYGLEPYSLEEIMEMARR